MVIIDEPQKISAASALESLSRFNALMVLRYSATHKDKHTKVHRLDAVDAYNQRLVKKISVRGITMKGLAGTTAHMYLDSIEVKKGSKPTALLEILVQTKVKGIVPQLVRVAQRNRLHDLSNGIEAYNGLVVNDVNAIDDTITLSNGEVVVAGQLTNDDGTEESKRRIQIQEVIRAHVDKERELFSQGIKVLSLFFIDEVVKYRDYDLEDTLGDYARIFEEEYTTIVNEILGELELDPATTAYRAYLRRDEVRKVHVDRR